MRVCYKIVDSNLKSLGMRPKGRAVPIVQYRIGKWTRPLEPISANPDEGGGLWVNPTLSQSKSLAQYLWRRYRRTTRIFTCHIGRVLCQPSTYRLKTNKVMLLEEISLRLT